MSQLALAHERKLIEKGCSLRFVVHNTPNADILKTQQKDEESEKDKYVPTIKLQMEKRGVLNNKYVDLDLDTRNVFTNW